MFGSKKREKEYTELTTNLQNISGDLVRLNYMVRNVTQNTQEESRDKYNSSINKFFIFLKNWWIFIALGSFLFIFLIAVRIYTIKFSGNFSVAIDYVQSYIPLGPYKWITYSIISLLVGLGGIGIPFFLGYRYVQKQKYKENQKVWSILCNIVWNCVLSGFIGGILFIVLVLYYSGLDITHWGDAIYISRELLITNIALMFIYIFIYHTQRLGVRVVRKEKYEKVYNILFSIIMIISLFGTLFLSDSDIADILVGGKEGDVSCVKDTSNPEDKGVTALPVSYDARGVQVFTGEYESNVKKWKGEGENGIHREYLQFEKGYKVTSGVCESGSHSGHPSQG